VIRVASCGICGSDLSCYKTGVYSGSVLGHEFAGVIESVENGSGFAVGQPVLVDPKVPCGACADCTTGAAYRCAIGLTMGPGGARDGALAELVSVPISCLHPMPDGLRVEDACLTEPLAVAIHGIERAGGVAPGEEAVVVGLGPIGLLTVAALRARGAGTITGVDPVDVRRSLAAALGADRVIGSMAAAPSGVPLVFECTGRADLLQDATNLAGAGGRVALLGVPIAEATVMTLPWVAREISVVGSIASSPDDFVASAAMLVADPGIARIITRRVPLEDVPAVFEELVTSPVDGKIVAIPNG
jgi:threonine dehydrogenase-like Zn-dependent dehydrogenase